MFRTDKFAEHLNVYHHNLQSYILKICSIQVSLDHCKCSEMVVIFWRSENVPTFNGIQMKIRRRSAEASEAKNTLVGLCLTWNVEVGIKMVNLDHSGGEVQHCSQMDRIKYVCKFYFAQFLYYVNNVQHNKRKYHLPREFNALDKYPKP